MSSSKANLFRVILVLLVSLGMLGTLIYYSIRSFERFETLVSRLNERQNWQAMLADDIAINISELDRLSRTYQLSLSREDLAPYLEKADELKFKIDSLYRGSANQPYHDEVDTLREVFAEKISNYEALILFKISQSQLQDDISALELLANSRDEITTDSMLVPTKEITTTTITTANQDSLAKRGLFSKIFGKKEEAPNREMMQERKVAYDSAYFEKVDTMMASVESALRKAESQRRYEQRLLANRELRIASNDLLIIDKLKSIAAEIGRLNEEMIHEQRVQAMQEARLALDNVLFWVLCGGLLTIIFTILVIRDIFQGARLQRDLRLAKNKAEKLANSREEFLANMSHELRTPLNSIVGFTDQISAEIPEAGEKIEHVRNSSEHLLRVVNDILDYSKIESGKLSLETIGFKPSTVIAECSEIMAYQAEQKSLDLIIESDSELKDLIVIGDPLRLKQILLNLLANAIKFTRNGHVRLATNLIEHTDEVCRIQFSVEDTGKGIEPKSMEKIFGSYQQEEEAIDRQYGGTGLGLSISKKLIEMQDGELQVQSQYGEGSTFGFLVNYKLGDSDVYQGNFQPQTVDIDLIDKRLLLVDDDEMNHILLKPSFKRWGLEFDSAYTGKEALELLKEGVYDFVMLDMKLPQMNGSDLIADIRSGEGITKIVLCTANPLLPKQQPDVIQQVDGFLLKPFKEYEVAAALSGGEDSMTKSNEESLSYTLANFSKFAGDDPAIIRKFIGSFIKSNKENLKLLHKALEQDDAYEIADLAHKMKNTYGQLEAEVIMKKLIQLEDPLNAISAKRKAAYVSEIQELSEALFIQLEEELSNFN